VACFWTAEALVTAKTTVDGASSSGGASTAEDSDTCGSWTPQQTKLFLDLTLESKEDLEDKNKKKKNVFKKIAQAMILKGFTVSWIQCEKNCEI